jgi:hypothetical protein
MDIEKAETEKFIGNAHLEESGFVPVIIQGKINSSLEIIQTNERDFYCKTSTRDDHLIFL